MRSSRLVVLALAAVAAGGLAPSSAHAQGSTPSTAQGPTPTTTQGFADSWYWGAYGGYMDFSTAFGTQNINTRAPSIGVDWMITRTNVALHVFAEQSYFSTLSSIGSPTGSAPLAVNINDMRRLGFDVMIFTPEYKSIKPYFNVGYSFNFITAASLRTCSGCNTFATQAAADSNQRAITNARSMGKVFGGVGAMWIYKKWAPFGQFTVMPTQGKSDWFLNGTPFTLLWSLGVRYNFGPSIDKW